MLRRSITKWELVLLFINGIIGAGIFGLPSKAFAQIGVFSLFALFICAVAIFIIIFCFAEVSSRFHETGGPYLYAKETFGELPGFLTGWLLLLTRFVTYAALINLFVTYLSAFSPAFAEPIPRIVIIVILTTLLGLVNHLGIRNTTTVNNFLTISKLLPLLLFIAVGLFFLEPVNFSITERPGFDSLSTTVLMLVFAFGGFESILVTSGEVKNPGRNLPVALLLSMSIIITIYLLIQIVCIGTLPELATSEKPLADAAGLFVGPVGKTVITIGALISITGTLNAVMLVGSRLPYAFSEEKHLPPIFAFVHPRYLTPTWSLLTFFVITVIVSLTHSFIGAVTLSALIRVLIYGIVCVALIRLRFVRSDQAGGFRAPFGIALACIGIGIALWLTTSAQIADLRSTVIATIPGLLIYLIVKSFHRKRSPATQS